MSQVPKVVVATANPHKLAEIRAILADAGLAVELVSMAEFDVPSPVEDRNTFEANALVKARACARATGLPAIADDSGLSVDALGGAPGVHSAYYAGTHGDDEANNAKLLEELAEVPDPQRTARFLCAAVAVGPSRAEVVLRGEMPGRIAHEARGTHGFGYDPLFIADDTGDDRTNGELSPEEKDAISHRGAAFRMLASHLPVVLLDHDRRR